jgi:hypothetical protein
MEFEKHTILLSYLGIKEIVNKNKECTILEFNEFWDEVKSRCNQFIVMEKTLSIMYLGLMEAYTIFIKYNTQSNISYESIDAYFLSLLPSISREKK